MNGSSEWLQHLRNRIDLETVPFTDRDSRLLVFRNDAGLEVRLAEFGSRAEDVPMIGALAFTDRHFNRLPDVGVQTLPHRVDFTTAVGQATLAFVTPDTLLIALPPGQYGFIFETPAAHIQPDRRGGIVHGDDGQPYTIAYTTNAAIVAQSTATRDDSIHQVRLALDVPEAGAFLLNITRTPGLNRFVPSPQAVIEASKQRWHAWFERVPAVAKAYRYQYYFAWWVVAANLIYPYHHPKREGMVPSKLGYVGIWNWDAYFHALALRHVDMPLARDQFRIMLDFQLDNGMIPDVVHDGGIIAHTTDRVEADVTKPPLTAWAIWKLYETDSDREFLQETYDALVRSQQWWFAHRDTDGNGLCEYQHPYSSGLDDSPLFDDGLPVEAPDLTAYLILQYDHLAKIAAVIGEDADAEKWRQKGGELARHLVTIRWDAEAGLFWAWRGAHRVRTVTPFNLFPLITGRLSGPIADRLVATLTDPHRFWTPHPVPTVAIDDPAYDPHTMWRGPVWININYLLIDGLRRAGYPEVAAELRERTLALIQSGPSIYEYYHPTTGQRTGRATSQFGWSAALFIDLVLEGE